MLLSPLQRQANELNASTKQLRADLDLLQAKVAMAASQRHAYDALIIEFAELTGLQASDPFRSPSRRAQGSAHVAILISGLQQHFATASLDRDDPDYLEFLPVSLKGQERLGPFVITEFALHLRGRYRAIPDFLKELAFIGERYKLVISVGDLRVERGTETSPNGAPLLAITLPVRAYFRD